MKPLSKILSHRIHVYWSLFDRYKLNSDPRTTVFEISGSNFDWGAGQEFHNMVGSCIGDLYNLVDA